MVHIYGDKRKMTVEGADYSFSFKDPDVDDIEVMFNTVVVEHFIKDLYEDGIITEEIRDNTDFFKDMLKEYTRRKDPHLIYEVLMEGFRTLDLSDYEDIEEEEAYE